MTDTLVLVGIIAVTCGLIAHAIDWWRTLGRNQHTQRDLVIGRDQHGTERRAALEQAQAETRARMNAVVRLSDRRL